MATAQMAKLTKVINAIGMACPGPLMALIGAIRIAQIGDVIEVQSSDEGSLTDIPAWVKKAGQELIEVRPEQGYARFVVRKTR